MGVSHTVSLIEMGVSHTVSLRDGHLSYSFSQRDGGLINILSEMGVSHTVSLRDGVSHTFTRRWGSHTLSRHHSYVIIEIIIIM